MKTWVLYYFPVVGISEAQSFRSVILALENVKKGLFAGDEGTGLVPPKVHFWQTRPF